MIGVAGRSPTLVSHSEAWRRHESSGDNLSLPSYGYGINEPLKLLSGFGGYQAMPLQAFGAQIFCDDQEVP